MQKNSSADGSKNPPHGQPGHRHDLPDGAPLPPSGSLSSGPSTGSASTTTSSVPGLNFPTTLDTNAFKTSSVAGKNPPHGQPGHRCDIAVGAPLDSRPAVPSTSSTNTVVNSNTNTPASSPKLNPSHGQPGHRCDIAVGAPLNSAPAKAAVNNNAPPPIINTPNVTTDPVQQVALAPSDTALAPNSSVRLNPAHGQPGHDCKIPVGKPLKQ